MSFIILCGAPTLKEVVDGNTTYSIQLVPHDSGAIGYKTVVDKQGYNIYIRKESSKSLAESAKAYYDQKNYDKAIADFTEALKLLPNYVWAYDMRGLAYLMKKDTARARADWKKALELDPKDDYARQMLEKYR